MEKLLSQRKKCLKASIYALINPDFWLNVKAIDHKQRMTKYMKAAVSLLTDTLNNAFQPKMLIIPFKGSPVMCEIGHDPFAEWLREEDGIWLNFGEGRQCPHGPAFMIKG